MDGSEVVGHDNGVRQQPGPCRACDADSRDYPTRVSGTSHVAGDQGHDSLREACPQGRLLGQSTPRRQFIVGRHFGPIPILGKRSEPTAQIGRLSLIDPAFAQIDRLRWMDPRHDDA